MSQQDKQPPKPTLGMQLVAFIVMIVFFFVIFNILGSVETKSHTYTIGDTVYTSTTTSSPLGDSTCSGSANSHGSSFECK